MKPLLPLLLSVLPATTSAWTFTWRNASSSSFLKNSHDPIPCTNIDQAKGQEFDFHPENDNYNLYVWATENCTGEYAGYTTPDVWRKKASKDLRSYLVDYGDGSGPMSTALATASTSTSTSSASTSTASTTSTTGTAAASASATATASASSSASSDTENGSAISGGAIAGIVIAIVAGLSILGAGFFYLGRRARRGNTTLPGSNPSQASPPPPPQNMYPSPSSIPPSSSHGGAETGFGATAQYPQAHGPTQQQQSMLYYGDSSPLAQTHSQQMEMKSGTQKEWVELPGEDMAAELSGSRQVNELEGHSKMMYQ
ncbi:EGFR-like transmembrane domain-containing protein [Aspergillus melleus]|uniref:EGFR-like transmembrane domain-containing protein n=1 Tax=Aspergillus melleus TaxID=138277 RepID=UPI001E8DB2B9|nr:uncharacterized protein LDX57_004381 [Aspergillus melleus]KAH8426648.1 hypothetical protein LDX57_004381 [Aspergillus melleus]